MGNSASHRPSDAPGKVILSNGAVITYDKPLTVAELMLEHPQQVVVEFQAVMCGKKPIPLPADQSLEGKKLYLMLPVRRGKPTPLSSEEARKLLANTNSVLKSNCAAGFLPLFGGLCSVNQDVGMCLADGREEEEKMKPDYFTDVLEGRPEYLNRQISGKGWKPSLDTIREKAVRAKVRHWLF